MLYSFFSRWAFLGAVAFLPVIALAQDNSQVVNLLSQINDRMIVTNSNTSSMNDRQLVTNNLLRGIQGSIETISTYLQENSSSANGEILNGLSTNLSSLLSVVQSIEQKITQNSSNSSVDYSSTLSGISSNLSSLLTSVGTIVDAVNSSNDNLSNISQTLGYTITGKLDSQISTLDSLNSVLSVVSADLKVCQSSLQNVDTNSSQCVQLLTESNSALQSLLGIFRYIDWDSFKVDLTGILSALTEANTSLSTIAEGVVALNYLLTDVPSSLLSIVQNTEAIVQNTNQTNTLLTQGNTTLTSIDNRLITTNSHLSSINGRILTSNNLLRELNDTYDELLKGTQYAEGVSSQISSYEEGVKTHIESDEAIKDEVITRYDEGVDRHIDNDEKIKEELITSIEEDSIYNTKTVVGGEFSASTAVEQEETKENFVGSVDMMAQVESSEQIINRYGEIESENSKTETQTANMGIELDNSEVDAEFLSMGGDLLNLEFGKEHLESSFSSVTGGFEFWGDEKNSGSSSQEDNSIGFIQNKAQSLSDKLFVLKPGELEVDNVGSSSSSSPVWSFTIMGTTFNFLDWGVVGNNTSSMLSDSPVLSGLRNTAFPIIYVILGAFCVIRLYLKLLTA